MASDRESFDKGIDHLTRKIADEGHLIQAGWVSLRYAVLPLDASEIQVREMRKAFFSGAAHLFASLTKIMDEDREPTDDDMRRLEMVSVELEAFTDELKREARGVSESGN